MNIYTPFKLFMKLRANVPTLNGAFLTLSEMSKKTFSGKIIAFAHEDSILVARKIHATALPHRQEIDFTRYRVQNDSLSTETTSNKPLPALINLLSE